MGENADPPYLSIARILRPQGRKGEVAAEILTDFPERFRHLEAMLLEVPGKAPAPVQLEHGWPHKGRMILKFAGIDSIESASRLRGLRVLIPWQDRTPLPPNHYYRCELQGCRVVWQRGRQEDGSVMEQEVGTVTEVEPTGGVDLLHVSRPDGKGEVLVPLAQEICRRIDLASRTILIDPPDELMDLNA